MKHGKHLKTTGARMINWGSDDLIGARMTQSKNGGLPTKMKARFRPELNTFVFWFGVLRPIFKLIEVSFSNFILLFYGKNIDWLSSTTCKRHYFTPTGPAGKSIIDYFAYNNSFKTVDTFVFNCPIKNDQLNVIQILQLSLT